MVEKTLSRRTVFQGKLLTMDVLEVELEAGRRSTREVVRHAGAVAVLVREEDGRFVLVRQYRKAIEQELLEVVAGGLEPGELPEACARREVREETGCEVRTLRALGHVYSAPGFCSERMDLFLAETAGQPDRQETDHDERVTAVRMAGEEIEAMIGRGDIHDAKTLATWLLFRRRAGEQGGKARA